ncbi:hypothetical protein PHYPO_G00018730 [Pangasianodon hypophthalmus]|uniref:Uncharacterized protein n=1 Tax=Pangasianodon hypophthalmus TaxID=310915 RepID=A0A5N5N5R6_PANHP|nr:hypothetical protein PHYPO_G00018730 [Pangasianodon hypophthalmus]
MELMLTAPAPPPQPMLRTFHTIFHYCRTHPQTYRLKPWIVCPQELWICETRTNCRLYSIFLSPEVNNDCHTAQALLPQLQPQIPPPGERKDRHRRRVRGRENIGSGNGFRGNWPLFPWSREGKRVRRRGRETRVREREREGLACPGYTAMWSSASWIASSSNASWWHWTHSAVPSGSRTTNCSSTTRSITSSAWCPSASSHLQQVFRSFWANQMGGQACRRSAYGSV